MCVAGHRHFLQWRWWWQRCCGWCWQLAPHSTLHRPHRVLSSLCINSFNCSNEPMKKVLSSCPFYRWGSRGSGSLRKSLIKAEVASESVLLTCVCLMLLWTASVFSSSCLSCPLIFKCFSTGTHCILTSSLLVGFSPREGWGYYDSSCHFPSPVLNIPGA